MTLSSSVDESARATIIGPEVGDRLRGTNRHEGRIVAVFSSVFYISLDTGLLCVTRADVDPGPFSVTTAMPRHVDFRTCGLAVNQKAYAEDRRIVVPGRLEVDLTSTDEWTPEVIREHLDPVVIACGLNRLRKCLPSYTAGNGLGGYLVKGYSPDVRDPVGLVARAPILAARGYAERAGDGMPDDCEWAKPLIGLGPGLTPSGDDFLGGFMVALHALGYRVALRQLWLAIRSDACAATNPISIAFLSAAAKGRGGASLHGTIAAVLSGDDPSTALARLAQLGHSSGWDALVGVVAVLDTVPFGQRHLNSKRVSTLSLPGRKVRSFNPNG